MSGSTSEHLAFGVAAKRIVRSVAMTAVLASRRRVRRRTSWVGEQLSFDDARGRVYRETVVVQPPTADPCVLVVEFRLRGIHGRAHTLFRWESLLNTPLFVGFPGFVSKLWVSHDEREVYRGVYEWDGPERAEAYVHALWWLLAPVSIRGSIRHHVVPGLRRDQWLAQRGHRPPAETDVAVRAGAVATDRAHTVVESVGGAVLIAAHLLARPLRHWRATWGATDEEAAATFPGDDLVPDATWSYTHAITVAAPPERLWPWIVQLGQGRGGFYSYPGLENLVGCHVQNATDVLDRFQHLAVGDPVLLHPKAPPLTVAAIEPGRHLVLIGSSPDGADASLWAFHLLDDGDGGTRLIERGRYAHSGGRASSLAFGPTLLEPISFVMSRKMLRTLRALAE
ncbi:hypothetical protein [Rhodococcus tukisamuensis]|uniref:Uncharacterized protein n=1 Tax=Rhodococcus tukisamuensis TaxID=168276 RepID=A0A1G6SY72_9NOCA|nr:hypothetical protein [Rhodococcus tukisamuensis]SDD21890.1 hypothetical protein SAMN05444580_103324 [Rhodococcus tukisamuensis]